MNLPPLLNSENTANLIRRIPFGEETSGHNLVKMPVRRTLEKLRDKEFLYILEEKMPEEKRMFKTLPSKAIASYLKIFKTDFEVESEYKSIKDRAILNFHNYTLAHFKKIVYGELGIYEVGNPLEEGDSLYLFKSASKYLDACLEKFEEYVKEPYFCNKCGILGESKIVTRILNQKRTCLGCKPNGLTIILSKYKTEERKLKKKDWKSITYSKIEKRCPKCEVDAKGYKNIDIVFGFRKVSEKSVIPQSWCRKCRLRKK